MAWLSLRGRYKQETEPAEGRDKRVSHLLLVEAGAFVGTGSFGHCEREPRPSEFEWHPLREDRLGRGFGLGREVRGGREEGWGRGFLSRELSVKCLTCAQSKRMEQGLSDSPLRTSTRALRRLLCVAA